MSNLSLAVLTALDNGLGSDGEVVNVLRLLTELIDGARLHNSAATAD